jgi:aminopeptidase N
MRLTAALHLDAKLSSHPIEVEIPDPGQIGQIFDLLSYAKAASGTFQVVAYKLDVSADDSSAPYVIEICW